MYSMNDFAEQVMGLRPEGVPIDLPYELGYQCPICKVYSELLHWSEYNAFLWCETCNYDYPSAMCIPLEGPPVHDGAWVLYGRDAAVQVFLDSIIATHQREL